MSDSYEPIIYTLTDEEGKSQQFEMLDSMEVNDQLYYAMIPYYDSEQDVASDYGELIVLKVVYDNNEELLATIDDDDEYQKIGNMFIEKLNEMFEQLIKISALWFY